MPLTGRVDYRPIRRTYTEWTISKMEIVYMEIIIMNHFELVLQYAPTGDQPQAIAELVKGFKEGNQFQTLLGVTGSGKTFTMANVIQ